MPNRILRDGILTSDKVNALSPSAEVFYRRVMSVVDDHGRFDGRLSIIRAAAYPLKLDSTSEQDIQSWLDETVKHGLIEVYRVDNKPFICLLNFRQQVRAKYSKYPQMPNEQPSGAEHMRSRCTAHAQHPIANAHLDVDEDVDGDEDDKTPKPPKGGGSAGKPKKQELQLVIPDSLLASDAFTAKWGEWVKFRMAMKKCKDFQAMFTEQLAYLEKIGPGNAVEMISQSIRNGWQGLHPLKPVPQQPNGNHPPSNGHPINGAQTVVFQQELERVIKTMRDIRGQYGDHQSWTPEDKQEFIRLRDRRNKLRELLGVVA